MQATLPSSPPLPSGLGAILNPLRVELPPAWCPLPRAPGRACSPRPQAAGARLVARSRQLQAAVGSVQRKRLPRRDGCAPPLWGWRHRFSFGLEPLPGLSGFGLHRAGLVSQKQLGSVGQRRFLPGLPPTSHAPLLRWKKNKNKGGES